MYSDIEKNSNKFFNCVIFSHVINKVQKKPWDEHEPNR